jgi:hypothetical protein
MMEILTPDEKNLDFDKDPQKLYRILNPHEGVLIPKFLKAPEVRKTARARAYNIFKHWKELNGILERHEELIRKRWLKKSREQRTKIILQAWDRPDLATAHRPDLLAMCREEKYLLEYKPTPFKDAFLWPSIKLEVSHPL